MQRCAGMGEFGDWAACEGSVTPTSDTCGDGIDQDYSNIADDGEGPCCEGATIACYSSPMGTQGVKGICRAGTRTCNSSGAFGVCSGEVLPRAETYDSIDDDCDWDRRRGLPDLHRGDRRRDALADAPGGGPRWWCAPSTTTATRRSTPS